MHAQAFYVTGHHCKNRNSGHSICEPQSPPPSTYFLVMITECVCYQDKVSPRFHIPGIHASPCKTIHILGGGGTQDNKQEAHSPKHCPDHCLPMIYPSSFHYLLPLFNGTTASIPMNHAPPMLCPAYWKCFNYSIIISDIKLVLRNCNCKFALRLPHITESILLLQVWSYKRFYHSLEFFLPICQCDKSSPSIMALQFNKEHFQRAEN